MIETFKDIYYADIKNNWLIRKAKKEDIKELSENLSKENVEELWVAHHLTPRQALEMALSDSKIALTIEVEGQLAGIYGVRNVKFKKAEVYFVVTNIFHKYGIMFLRNAKRFINILLEKYKHLEGHVYAKNLKSILWMRYCGAFIGKPEKYGIEGQEFCPFYFKI